MSQHYTDPAREHDERALPNLTAVRIRNGWVIRPRGALGTCGWINGVGWAARFVKRLPRGIAPADAREGA